MFEESVNPPPSRIAIGVKHNLSVQIPSLLFSLASIVMGSMTFGIFENNVLLYTYVQVYMYC